MTDLLSVGLDIGTTTTQLVISRLTLENVMPGARIPRVKIINKAVLYVGKVYYTPFIDRHHVDGEALRSIIRREYARAGFTAGQIDTGAVIITGETAKKHNAAEIVRALAGFAGDFVVETAGPDLESIFAGKGSGAFRLSRQRRARIVNVDIGGGTANLAVFAGEKIQGTACLNIGGRLIEIDPASQIVTYVAQPGQAILNDLGDPLQVGDKVDVPRLMPIVRRMVEVLDQVLLGEDLDQLAETLLMTKRLPAPLNYDGLVFSGGVGRYYYLSQADWFRHGDLGVLLALALRDARILAQTEVLAADETLHATVMGAAAHALVVSGSTIELEANCLPLRNLPIISLDADCLDPKIWLRARERFASSERVAYFLPEMPLPGFRELSEVARGLLVLQHEYPQKPLVVMAEQDIGKALGQAILAMEPQVQLVCLDEVAVKDGDYVDINRVLPEQDSVPILVKTLVFPT